MEQRSNAECVGHTMGREWTSGAIFAPVPLPGVLLPPPHSETGGAPEHAHAPTPWQMPSQAEIDELFRSREDLLWPPPLSGGGSKVTGSSRGGRTRDAVRGGPTCSI